MAREAVTASLGIGDMYRAQLLAPGGTVDCAAGSHITTTGALQNHNGVLHSTGELPSRELIHNRLHVQHRATLSYDNPVLAICVTCMTHGPGQAMRQLLHKSNLGKLPWTYGRTSGTT